MTRARPKPNPNKEARLDPDANVERDRSQYEHPTAFCHVEYVGCESGEREYFWNSRDAPPPFEIPLTETGEPSKPSGSIAYDPDYVPCIGERVIVDMTDTRLMQLLHGRLDFVLREGGAEAERIQREYASREDFVRKAVEHVRVRLRHCSDLVTVNAAWLEEFVRERAVAEVMVIDMNKLLKDLDACAARLGSGPRTKRPQLPPPPDSKVFMAHALQPYPVLLITARIAERGELETEIADMSGVIAAYKHRATSATADALTTHLAMITTCARSSASFSHAIDPMLLDNAQLTDALIGNAQRERGEA